MVDASTVGPYDRRPEPGLRVRIAATIACIVIAAVVILALAVHLLVVQNRINQQRAAADNLVQVAMSIYQDQGVLTFDARLDDPSVPSELRRQLTRSGTHGTYLSGRSIRDVWAAGRVAGHILSIHSRFPTVDASVRAVDRALLIAGIATAVVASAVGALSANRLSRRLRLAARAARALATAASTPGAWPATSPGAADGSTLREAVGQGRDEVGDLADAVDAMAARLAERLQSEQRFTADVAHDLRTPLTGLNAAASLLDDSRPSQMVRDRVDALTTLVEELLEVARLDSRVETAQLEYAMIPAIVTRAVQRGIAKGEYPQDAVAVSTHDQGEPVLTDPRRLERVLSNLIRNALQHGRPPVTVEAGGSRVVVTDAGPGFTDEFLAKGPQRFQRSSANRGGGHGLGLIIAAGQTAVLGGNLQFGNAPGGGAQVVIDLPGAPPGRQPSSGSASAENAVIWD
ncbi:HAMP domain-containing sensor histidine kinase [Microlunatus sp. Gsoil 973]|jgi:signal transduction histidine kinase|uniref:sensor histidine kinase n=1 Tax=Microlunatus sp. Gsoil 973 TaxID=2672569 RepID=UPI0012B4C6F1|nr:HAMP domain-containing sensor histidine kinase [Microlunatus sp. Gsoil 973]QGN32681.1 HAMP domain-containing protein [Microlunatus sp. Gsoil 973]